MKELMSCEWCDVDFVREFRRPSQEPARFCGDPCRGRYRSSLFWRERGELPRGVKWKTSDGYFFTWCPSRFTTMGHCRSRRSRRTVVLEHRLVMARHLGRALRPDEIVHHLNGVRTDNRLKNLALVKKGTHEKGTVRRLLQIRIRELEKLIGQKT